MNRRSFLALAGGIVVATREPVRAYSFVGGWNPGDDVGVGSGGLLYAEGGVLKWRAASGHVIPITFDPASVTPPRLDPLDLQTIMRLVPSGGFHIAIRDPRASGEAWAARSGSWERGC